MVNWKYIKEFGLYIFFVNGVSRILRKMKCKPSTLNAYDRFKHKIDEAYLLRKYEYLLKSNHIEIVKKSSIGGGKHTFVFWWQGFETAPEIVKLCINSMKKHADDLVLIDKNNYTQWVGLPDYIVSKFNTGDISLAHFSDVIRFYLLYFYGGTWIDATCFLSREIPGEIRETEFWSINGAYKNILGWRWTSFFYVWTSRKYNSQTNVDILL